MGQIIRSPVSSLFVSLSVCPLSLGRNFDPIWTKLGTDPRSLKRKNDFVGGQNPTTGSPIFTPFYPKLAPIHNAFSMGALKHFPNVAC